MLYCAGSAAKTGQPPPVPESTAGLASNAISLHTGSSSLHHSKFVKSALTLPALWAITTLLACTPPGVATATLQPDQTSIPAPAAAPSQTQTSTAALWKTYRNETYGFSFEYPAIYDEPAYRDSCGLKENSEGIRLGLRSGLRISNSGGWSLEQYANDLLTGRDWSVDVPKNGIVSGLEALTVEYRFGGANRYGTFTLVKRAELIFYLRIYRRWFL